MLSRLQRIALAGLAGILIFCVVIEASASGNHSSPENNKEPLTLGFFPIISTVALFKRFAPLRDYLSNELGRPVVLETARDFPTFLKRTDQRRYDIVVTAPHFAVRAADSGKYVVRATHVKDVEQLFIVRKDSEIKSVSDLAGKTIATPPRSALMTMMGKQYLKEAGLTGDKQPKFLAFTTHNAANEAVIGGEVDAAIASSNIIKKALKQRKPVRILSKGLTLTNMATLVATDLDGEIGEAVTETLVKMKNTETGKQVLKQISFPGFKRVTAKDYEPARPYMEQALGN
ncbi:MAG: phosphate/phosphite/phosphonate ABC transporter substrate-binding protein [Gammaproteobacteria bacterium]|nr:phosphate/phosphite/phosphonate ABC transporter substrate-binding protein [Gammaproteobacteria bacterium]